MIIDLRRDIPTFRTVRQNQGRKVRLMSTGDTHTNLQPGVALGTYQFLLKHADPDLCDEHHIDWDSGSQLTLLEGVDSFEFADNGPKEAKTDGEL